VRIPCRSSLYPLLYLYLLALGVVILLPVRSFGQGETTSAIVGQVTDSTSAALPGATVTITNHDTGLRRSAKTDDAGRFIFPQLKPGSYSVRVEVQGFEPQQNDGVFSGLGQKQTVNSMLVVARPSQTIDVNPQAPILNPSNANTSTTVDSPALEDLPNPGGDLTYPLQFAPGALINTAGSGNDFVGGTNGYGNVDSTGCLRDLAATSWTGWKRMIPLTNLNGGRSSSW
jgi:Carboxypeptidase regulatory-like domain